MANKYLLNSALYDILHDAISSNSDYSRDVFANYIDVYCSKLNDDDAQVINNSDLQGLRNKLRSILLDDARKEEEVVYLNICLLELLSDHACNSVRFDEATYVDDLRWFINRWCTQHFPEIYDLPKILIERLLE